MNPRDESIWYCTKELGSKEDCKVTKDILGRLYDIAVQRGQLNMNERCASFVENHVWVFPMAMGRKNNQKPCWQKVPKSTDRDRLAKAIREFTE